MEPTGLFHSPYSALPRLSKWDAQDIALLEDAAKALGTQMRLNWVYDRPQLLVNQMWVSWNPFDEVADAWELMVNLHMCINANEPIEVGTYPIGGGRVQGEYEQGCEVWLVAGWIPKWEDHRTAHMLEVCEVYGDDAGKATRRAIVRLAALIAQERNKLHAASQDRADPKPA